MFMKRNDAPTRALSARDPFGALRQMTAEFDRLFSDPFARWPAALGGGAAFVPEIDVYEKDGRLVTKVDLPGMKKEDVTLEITDGILVVSGERKTELEEKKEGFYRCEREYGTFSRSIPLPKGVKLDDVKATFADGVLEVSMPLPAAAAPTQKIEIAESPTAQKPAA
jgi:HSP20 family protein